MSVEALTYLLGIVVGVIIYPNIGWLLYYFVSNPEEAGIFKRFFEGPNWMDESFKKTTDTDDILMKNLSYFMWPVFLLITLAIWLIQIVIWIKKAIFGGIAKKVIGYKE